MSRGTASSRAPSFYTNLVLNGGFESNTTNWIASSKASIARDTTVSKFGNSSVKVTLTQAWDIAGVWGGGNGNGARAMPVVAGQAYTASVWILGTAGEKKRIGLEWQVTNTVSNSADFTMTGDWQRITVTATAPVGESWVDITVYTHNVPDALSDPYWVDGVQFQTGSIASNYVETNGATVAKTRNATSSPALTMTTSGNEITDATRTTNTSGDGAAVPNGYGIWEASTNLVTNGGFETNVTTGWTIGNNDWATNTGGTRARDTSQFKFGTASCKITGDNTNPAQGIRSSLGTSSGSVYTASAWVNAPVGITFQICLGENAQFKLNKANFAGTGAWQYVTVSWTGTGNAFFVWVDMVTQGTSSIYVDGVQVEQTPIATPYVETNGASASRSLARVQAPSSLITGSQGWFAARLRMGWSSTVQPSLGPNVFSFSDSASEGLQLHYNLANNQWRVTRFSKGSSANVAVAATPAVGDLVTLVGKWDSGNVYISVNGANFTSAVNTNIPTLSGTTFDIGSSPNTGGGTIDSNILWIAAGRGALVNADATTLNALGTTAPTWSQLMSLNGGYASPSLLWPCATSAATQASRFGLTQARNLAV